MTIDESLKALNSQIEDLKRVQDNALSNCRKAIEDVAKTDKALAKRLNDILAQAKTGKHSPAKVFEQIMNMR